MGFWHVLMGIEGGSPTALPSGDIQITITSTNITVTITSTNITITFTDGKIMGTCYTKLLTCAPEQGTFPVTFSFLDEAGDALTPDSLTWSLYDTDGNVINSRSGEVIAADTSVTIVLTGDDLAITAGVTRLRRLTLEGTFTSDLGSGIPLKAEAEFEIGDLVGVS